MWTATRMSYEKVTATRRYSAAIVAGGGGFTWTADDAPLSADGEPAAHGAPYGVAPAGLTKDQCRAAIETFFRGRSVEM